MRAFCMATARFRMPLSRCRSVSWPRSAAASSALGTYTPTVRGARRAQHIAATRHQPKRLYRTVHTQPAHAHVPEQGKRATPQRAQSTAAPGAQHHWTRRSTASAPRPARRAPAPRRPAPLAQTPAAGAPRARAPPPRCRRRSSPPPARPPTPPRRSAAPLRRARGHWRAHGRCRPRRLLRAPYCIVSLDAATPASRKRRSLNASPLHVATNQGLVV